MNRAEMRTRRRVLRLAAITASTAIVAGCGDDEPDPDKGTIEVDDG